MSKSPETVAQADLEALWARSEPDLELGEDGEIRPIRPESSRPLRSTLAALGMAAPAAIGAAGIALSEVARWD